MREREQSVFVVISYLLVLYGNSARTGLRVLSYIEELGLFWRETGLVSVNLLPLDWVDHAERVNRNLKSKSWGRDGVSGDF